MTQTHILFPFPQFRQSAEWSCGAVTLQMILAYYGMDVREERLRILAGTTPKRGTPVVGMQRVLRNHGLRVTSGQMTINDVKQSIRKKIPVILLLQAWTTMKHIDWVNDWKDGHYAVAIGYDTRRMIFADPASIHRTALTYSELEYRWHDMDNAKNRYEHFGIAVYAKKPQYRHSTIIHMD